MSNTSVTVLSRKIRNIVIGVFGVFIVFCVIAPNLKLIASPFTPIINGKIIDENSGKPIKDMLVLITHEIRYSYIPGNGYVDYKNSDIVKTNENGEFTSKRMLKPMSISILGMYDRDYGGSHLITLNNKYKYVAAEIPLDGKIILTANVISNMEIIRKNYKIYDVIEKGSYPLSIKKHISDHKVEAAELLLKYRLAQ